MLALQIVASRAEGPSELDNLGLKRLLGERFCLLLANAGDHPLQDLATISHLFINPLLEAERRSKIHALAVG